MTTPQEWLNQVRVLLNQKGISPKETDLKNGAIHFGCGENRAVDLNAAGTVTCSFKVDLEDLRTLISGDTTEDLSEDELCRVAREELRPIVDRHRWKFRQVGFQETIESDHDQYAIVFTKPLTGVTAQEASDFLKWCCDALKGGLRMRK